MDPVTAADEPAGNPAELRSRVTSLGVTADSVTDKRRLPHSADSWRTKASRHMASAYGKSDVFIAHPWKAGFVWK